MLAYGSICRQLLTENIMHVCIAMMLDSEATPSIDVLEASCRLIALVIEYEIYFNY